MWRRGIFILHVFFFHRRSLFYSPLFVALFCSFILFFFFFQFKYTGNIVNLRITGCSYLWHLPQVSYEFLRCTLYLLRNRVLSRCVQLIAVIFSGHNFYLKGVPVSSDLGTAWSAAFIVRTGGDSPIKGTFVYLSAPISMHKSDQARRFIAPPNVVKCLPRDTHTGKPNLPVLRILNGYRYLGRCKRIATLLW